MIWRVNQMNFELGEPMVHFAVSCTRDSLEDLLQAMLMYRQDGDIRRDTQQDLEFTVKYLSAVLKSFDLMLEPSDQYLFDSTDCDELPSPAVTIL